MEGWGEGKLVEGADVKWKMGEWRAEGKTN